MKKFDLTLKKVNRVLKAITAKFGIIFKQKVNSNDLAEFARVSQHKLLNIYLGLGDCYEETNLKFRALRSEFEKAIKANTSFSKAKKKDSINSYTDTFETIVEVSEAELKFMHRGDKLSQALGKIEILFEIIENFQSASSAYAFKEVEDLRRLKEEKIRPYIR